MGANEAIRLDWLELDKRLIDWSKDSICCQQIIRLNENARVLALKDPASTDWGRNFLVGRGTIVLVVVGAAQK